VEVIEADSEEAVAEIIRDKQPVEIVGSGSKLALGRPVVAARRLGLSRLAGITQYEPAELVLTVKAATPLAEIEAALAEEKQALAFEPPNLSRLLGIDAEHQTLGGIVATNLAGPRRCVAGGVRDHVLGLRAVNGRGEIFSAGGKVVKNVTGYDLCKLLTGSFGTMAVFTELTVKVLPAAETEESVVVRGQDAAAAVAAMSEAMGSSAGISGAAYLPFAEGGPLTALRLEGFGPSVQARRQRLQLALSHYETALWGEEGSRSWWRDLRDVGPLAGQADQAIWKISLAATQAPSLLQKLGALHGSRAFLDWGGALLWLGLPCGSDAQAAQVRSLLPAGAHAMLVVAPEAVRASQPVFQPLPAAQAAVEDKVRRSFDPDRLLNPGRMG
jgi:glycolate oxidase FAD binding subunit